MPTLLNQNTRKEHWNVLKKQEIAAGVISSIRVPDQNE